MKCHFLSAFHVLRKRTVGWFCNNVVFYHISKLFRAAFVLRIDTRINYFYRLRHSFSSRHLCISNRAAISLASRKKFDSETF